MSPFPISVIIPAFNSASTLPRALDSVFSQSYAQLEVVVVDDGSTDDLGKVLAPYQGRLKLVRQQNAGASAARNTGAKHAQGKWLAFLDADDFWHHRKLELQLRACEARPGLLFCFTDCSRWTPDQPHPANDALDPQKLDADCSMSFEQIFRAPYLGTPGVMISRDLFMQLGGFREDLRSAEDVDLWLRAAYGRTIARLHLPLFFVVETRGSLRSRVGEGTYRDNLQVIEDFCRTHPEFAEKNAKLVRRARAKVYEDWGSGALTRRELQKARKLLGLSLQYHAGLRSSYLFSKALLLRT